ncbi:MAG: class I SAM-dependent methyltransferase [Proteobacteria bacterium]|nr:class I SAM-dependent methyltransferase [Pseudomonadota bacterium]
MSGRPAEPTGKPAAELAAEQAAFWNGPGGTGWLAAYERIQRSIAGIGDLALAAAAVRHGEHAIDVGCGTGGTTAVLAHGVGLSGHVLGVDISETLVDAARTHRLDNATFVVGDAARHPFREAAYDLVFSRFGVMFFAEPVAAFRNLHRALKPTGRLVFVAWRSASENPWSTAPVRAAAPFLPPLPRPGPEDPGQFSFGDRARVERILRESGFHHLRIEPIDRPIWMGDSVAEVVASTERFGALARAFAGAAPDAVARAKQAVATLLAPHEGPEGVHLPGACWLVEANAA